jgi:hypothetical protein
MRLRHHHIVNLPSHKKERNHPMANQFQVNLNLDGQTVIDLTKNGFLLYGFKGLDGPPKAAPVVWFSTNQFSESNQIIWQEQYGGYTSRTTPIAPKAKIVAEASAPMTLGQLMTIDAGGVPTVTNDQDLGMLEILNATNTTFTCGVTVVDPVSQTANAICAFELLPGDLEEFLPIEKIFLMFATVPVDTGTVIEQSFGPGILIDMTGQTAPVVVSFTTSIANGWSGPGNTTNFAADADLLSLLINAGGSSGVAQRAGQRALARRRAA